MNAGNGCDHVYHLSNFFGFFVSLAVQCIVWVLHVIFPAEDKLGPHLL